MAASLHGDTPYSGNLVTSVLVTPYTTSVDVNGWSGRSGGPRCHREARTALRTRHTRTATPDGLHIKAAHMTRCAGGNV